MGETGAGATMDLIGYRFRDAGDPGGGALDERTLAEFVGARAAVDFERYAPGSARTVATLRWSPDGAGLVSGSGETHTLAAAGDGLEERVLAHLKGFAETHRVRDDAGKAAFNRSPPTEGTWQVYREFGDARGFLRDGQDLREILPFRKDVTLVDIDPADASEAVVARLVHEEGGGVAFVTDDEREDVPAGTSVPDLATRWEAFSEAALERHRAPPSPGP